MKRQTACLIINPRLGKNLAKLSDMIAVFSAAGWKTETLLKGLGGHTRRLAKDAAEAGFDRVIGYGGDGTLNQVVNGVMAAKRHRSIVGIIPGGTANVWAHEIGVPEDPVKASLLLVNSEARGVDLGHVELDSAGPPRPPGSKDRRRRERHRSGGRHHFLLMAGLGLDAAILRRVSKALKEKIGEPAVALAAIMELPSQHAFPMEIRSSGAAGEEDVLWSGEALQVIVGNTRRYGNIAELTPEAYLDDGVLDVCVITAGDPLTVVEQILSILLHRRHGHGRSEYLQGAHFRISVPAWVDLQLDGSRVKLKDHAAAPDRSAVGTAEDPAAAMVTYRFDAVPRALHAAIPCTYGGALFKDGSGRGSAPAKAASRPEPAAARQRLSPGQIKALLAHGRRITVVASGPNPERQGSCIVAGRSSGKTTGGPRPVAVRIDRSTTLVRPTGEPVPAEVAAELPEGGVIVVEGKQSKYGVIRATRLVVMT